MSEYSPLTEDRIVELWVKYYTAKLSDIESQELEGYCEKWASIRWIMQHLDDEELVRVQISRWKEAETEKNWELMRVRLQASPLRENANRNVMRLSRWSLRRSLSVAAVIVVVAISGFLLLVRKPAKEKNTPLISSRKGLTPGYEKVTLILDNGQVIELDSTTIGKVINGGGVTFKQTGAGHLEVAQVAGYAKQGQGKPDSMRYNTLQTPRGGQFSITLPEGTEVSLNNASTLRVPIRFPRTERKVNLAGEAYFKVIRNVQLPFSVTSLVNGREQTVNVLGTSFNISAYPDERSMRTTLVTGKVKVTSRSHTELPEPAEQIVVEGDHMVHRKGVNIDAVLAWKEGTFNFVDDSLPDVLRQIARWYDKEVVVRGPMDPHTFQGELDRNTPLPLLLANLSGKNTIFHYALIGNTIIISQ